MIPTRHSSNENSPPPNWRGRVYYNVCKSKSKMACFDSPFVPLSHTCLLDLNSHSEHRRNTRGEDFIFSYLPINDCPRFQSSLQNNPRLRLLNNIKSKPSTNAARLIHLVMQCKHACCLHSTKRYL